MTAKTWARRILMGFVLVTIGFSLGRQTAPGPASDGATAAPPGPDVADRLVVYATHMTFRCTECTQIERYARELLETEFAAELDTGRIVLVSIDYLQDEPFADRYDIAASTLVLSLVQEGEETHFERLDDVWTHVRNREAYMDFVRQAVQEQLARLDGDRE